MDKLLEAQTYVQKVIFSTGRQSYDKSHIFQFLAGVGVSVQMFVLGPCAIVKLQIFGRALFKICFNCREPTLFILQRF